MGQVDDDKQNAGVEVTRRCFDTAIAPESRYDTGVLSCEASASIFLHCGRICLPLVEPAGGLF